MKKVDRFAGIYSNMRKGIFPHAYHMTAERLPEMNGFSFVFISIDDPKAKRPIVDFLIQDRIPFIDTGMDLSMDHTNSIRGKCRITLGTPEAFDHIPHAINFSDVPENDLYRNVQVADLNMLNAALAVIKWKKMLGFYADDPKDHLAIYTVHTNGIAKEVCG